MRALLALWALLVAPTALAVPDCEPLGEDAFRALFLDALAAIDRDDAALHAAIVQEVRGRISCLTFAPPPRLWADFLVGLAVVEFSQGGEWEEPMAAALRIRPNVDRLVSGAHPINRWEPPPIPGEDGGAVPDGVAFYVDGQPSDRLPPTTGLYLVQKEDEGYFETRWTREAGLDMGWVTAPVERPRRFETWAFVSGGLGVGAIGQDVAYDAAEDVPVPEFSDYLAEDVQLVWMPRAAFDGLVGFGRVGFYGHVEVTLANLSRATGATAYTGPYVMLGPFVPMIGFGARSFEVFEGGCNLPGGPAPEAPSEIATSRLECDTVASGRSVPLPFGYGGLWIRATKPWRPQPQLLISAGPFVKGLDLSVAVAPPPTRRGTRWRYAATLRAGGASFVRRDRDYRVVVVPWDARFGMEAGIVFGRVR